MSRDGNRFPVNQMKKKLFQYTGIFLAVILPAACGRQDDVPVAQDDGAFDQARALMTEGDILPAVELFSRVISRGERLAEARLERGKAYLALGRPESAAEDFSRVIGMDPKNADAHYQLGVARARNKDFSGAAEAYSTVIGVQPDYVKAYVNRAGIYAQLGKMREAIADCDAAIALDPYDASFLVNRGIFYNQSGDPERSRRDWDEALRLNPKLPGAYFARAVLYHAAKSEYREALADLDRGIELQPGYSYALQERAKVKHELEDYEGAIEDFSVLISRFPGMAPAWLARAKAYEAFGAPEKALADRRKALELDPALADEP